ncbi:hypothetical protein ACET3Z_017901 [Daucus carota]
MVRPFRPCFQDNIIIQKYSNYGGEGTRNGPVSGQEHHEDQEGIPRAPSTADEFKRVAEEKAKQGVRSQTVEKAEDATLEATIGDSSDFESIKETYKEPVGKGKSH